MDRLAGAIARLSYAAGCLAGLVLLAITALTMAEVVSRYALRHPLILSDELGGYAMVAISFLGLAYCALERGHIRITFVIDALKADAARRVRLVTLALAIVFVVVAAWVSWSFLADSFARDMRSNSLLRTPLRWPQSAIPIGLSLFALMLLAQFVQALRRTQER